MTDPRAHLRALADALPPDAVVPVPVGWLRDLLEPAPLVEVLPPGPPPADFTVAVLAARFGRKPSTVRLWVERGMFPGAYRLHGREWRVPLDSLTRFEATARQAKPTTPHPAPAGRRSKPRLSDWRQAS